MATRPADRAAGKAKKPTKPARKRNKNQSTSGVLSDRHARFVSEYLKDGNATQAYVRAGYKATVEAARRNGARLLTNADIAAAIAAGRAQLIAKTEQETGITLQRVVQELARLALFDPRKFFNADGSPKQITELDDDTAATLAGMEIHEEFEGSGENRVFVGYTKKYKLAEKNAALDKLMKHLGGYKADNDQQKQENPLLEILAIVHGKGSTLPLKP